MIEVNLIPDIKYELLRARMMRNFVISIATIVGIVSIIVVVVLGLMIAGQAATGALQDRRIDSKNKELMAIKDLDKMVTVQHQLSEVHSLHDQKSIDSRIFDVIHAINPSEPNNAKISTLKYNPELETITVEGSVAAGFTALETFKKTVINAKIVLSEPERTVIPLAVGEIESGPTSFGENAEGARVLRFSFSFKYSKELFASSGGSVVIETDRTKVDVTDSRLGVPDGLFGGRPADSRKEGS